MQNASPVLGIEDILRQGDRALYEAKFSGKDQFVFYADIEPQVHEQLCMMEQVREAMCQRRFRVHFSPLFQLEDGRLMQIEARIIWQEDSETKWNAAAFRPTMVQNGFIRHLDIFLFDEICSVVAAPKARLQREGIRVSLLISV